MKNNHFEPYKKLYTKIVILLEFICIMLFFYNIWFAYLNELMDRSFLNKGNVLILVVYAAITIMFFKAWGAFRFGYSKLGELIVSQVLAIICTNILSYFQIVLMVGNIEYLMDIALKIFYLILYSGIVCIIFDVIFTKIYIRLFPPYRILQINGEHQNYLRQKLGDRDDKYTICEEISVFEEMENIFEKISQYDAVLLNDIPSSKKNIILKYCFDHSMRVYFTPKISDIIVKGATEINLFDSPLFLCRNIGLTAEERFIKRLVDIVFSFVGLVTTLPVGLIVALCIKLQDGGPVFYLQERCTYQGKVFWIYKFRSMIVNAEKEGASCPATDDDDRITKVGRFIRKTRIDELPQLLNILKGDMSIVGPRPERVEHIEKYSADIPEFTYRLKVKGGLTGYAQVYGRYNTTAYDKLKMDMLYIVKYSLLLDFQIILETVKILFQKESTQGFTEEQFNRIHAQNEDLATTMEETDENMDY